MKKIFLLILTALAFASCTLYMDEPEDEKKGKDDNIENGDGFSSPRTDVTADGTTTYQFNPTTKVFDETNSQYVLNAEDSVVWLSTSTPYEMIPQVGDAVYSTFSEKFPNAMMGKVVSVTKENGMIKCVYGSTSLGHVFKELEVHYEIPIGAYTDSTIANKSLVEKVKYAKQRTRKEYEFKPEINHYHFEINGEKSLYEKKWFSGSLKGHVSFDYEERKYRKVNFDLDLVDRSFYFSYSDSTITDLTWDLGCTAEFKAKILAFDTNLLSGKALKIVPLEINIAIPSTPFVVNIDPSLEGNFSGNAQAKFSTHSVSVKRYGAEKKKGWDEAKIIEDKYDKSTARVAELSANYTAELDAVVTVGVTVAKFKDNVNVGASFTFGPKFDLTAGLNLVDYEYLITKPLTLDGSLVLKAALDIHIQWNEKYPIFTLTPVLADYTIPLFTLYMTSNLSSFNIIPLERNQSGEYKEKYRAEALLTLSQSEQPEALEVNLNIYNNEDKLVKVERMNKATDYGTGMVKFRKDFEIDSKKDETYYGVITYSNGEKIYRFDDKMPFGVKIYMGLDNCRQAEGTYNPKARKHYNFEARGSLKTVGSSKVSQWGLRFRLYDKYGKPVSASQCTYFDPTDGVKSWGLKISSKKKGPYVLKIEPIYKTGYGTSTKVNVVEDKIVELPLDPDFGECKEKDWEKPDVYVNLTDKK